VIPFELTSNNRIVLDADVNGTKGKFFWDTGSYLSQVDCRVDNLKFSNSTSFAQEHTSSYLSYYTLDGITFSGIRINAKSDVSKIPDSLKESILIPEKLDGVLGINIFEGYWCEISFSERKIYLYSKKPRSYSSFIPAQFEKNYILVSGDIDGDTTRFYIDTGFNETIVFPESVIRKKDKSDYQKIESTTSQNLFLVKANDISIFDKHIKNVYIITNTVMNQITLSGGTGLIGVNFLKNSDLLFDFTQLNRMRIDKVYYKPIHKSIDLNKYFISVIPNTGILQVFKQDNGLRIGYILSNSHLYKKGIRPNFIITKIDGVKYTDSMQSDFLLSIYYPNKNVVYTFEYNNREMDIEYLME
jgi:predicted aspartyl protease